MLDMSFKAFAIIPYLRGEKQKNQAEGSDYDFGNSAYSKTTANFAAVVYKATTHVGFAMPWNGPEAGYDVAAAFAPRGGARREDFRRNVFPPLLVRRSEQQQSNELIEPMP